MAARILEETGTRLAQLRASHAQIPGLAVVGFEGHEESRAYTRTLRRHAEAIGLPFRWLELPAGLDQAALLRTIEELNLDSTVAGILVETPIPSHLDQASVFDAIDPRKDVDCSNSLNIGRLFLGRSVLPSATPMGGIEILRHYGVELEGKFAVVVGRSAVVGRPLAIMLLHANATVAICHSRTPDLAALTRQADILAVAVGKPRLIQAPMVKPGAVVLDFGTNFMDGRMVGDVDTDQVAQVASAISPVPGGTGPVTAAVLIRNVVEAARLYLTRGK